MRQIKTAFSVLLAAAMIFSFAACGGSGNGEETLDESAPQEETSAEESGTEARVYTAEQIAACEAENAQIAALLNRDVDRTLAARNVFFKQSYTYSREPSDGYPDEKMNLLTDGQSSDVFDHKHYVAWKGAQSVTVDFDLGIGKHELADVEVGCLRQISYGIGLPSYVELFISADGEDYYSVGKQLRPKGIEDSARLIYRFALPKATAARYVRIVLGKPDASFLFVDEVWGYEYRADAPVDRTPGGSGETKYDMIDDLYKCSIDASAPRVTVSKSDADYDTVQNLMLLDTTELLAQNFEPVPNATNSNSTLSKFGILKDGVYPPASDRGADKWVCFYRGSGRHVIADLGCEMTVSGFKTVFLDNETSGIGVPPASYVSLSSDGVNWVSVYGDYNPDYGHKTPAANYTIDAKFKGDYKARFVRISFPTEPDSSVSTIVYMGEVEITGKKSTEGAAEPVENTDTHYGRLSMPDEYGIHNILFAPVTDKINEHCTTSHVILTDDAAQYLYYRNQEGVIEGKMFDCIAFSVRNQMASYVELFDSMSFYYEELFDYEGMNLNALEEAQQRLNEELGANDKVKVMISVDCPRKWNTFRGNQIATLEDAIECLKWQADEIIRLINEKDYKNIEFVGFYWHHESIARDSFDAESMKWFTGYARSLGYITHWCPYYDAYGLWRNRELGIDIACLQPGYMFHPETVYARLTSTYELARIYGMCVEIEIEDYSSTSATNRYYDYLAAGRETGYMYAVKVYYQGAFPGVFAGAPRSTEELRRRVYDMTGHYAMEVLTAEELDFAHAETGDFHDKTVEVKAGEHADFKLIPTADLVYRILLSPLYGDYRLDKNGDAYYKPKKGYLGEDCLVMQIVDDNGELKTATVTFKITD
ncbi:MAG: DUF4855 domain-containing protein [Clostridia bacterium]|nr:DUF4855 domain-containing protein [Clostridia bacterium]